MWAYRYILGLAFPLLNTAFEIAFTPFNIYSAPDTIFAYKPLPEFNWSVYPRYSCNGVNWEGGGYTRNSTGFVSNILFREAPGTPARIPQVVAFYDARLGRTFQERSEPCHFNNARMVAYIGTKLDNLDLGRIVRISAQGGRRMTHWKEIIPAWQNPEWVLIQYAGMKPWSTAYRIPNTGSDIKWDIKPTDAENRLITESVICWNPWYFASVKEDPAMAKGVYYPDLDTDELLGDDIDSHHGYGSDYDSEDYGYDSDESSVGGRTNYNSDPDSSPGPLAERQFRLPKIISGSNPRWVRQPTTRCRGTHPTYVQWRNQRILNAGDHIRHDPNAYLYKQSYQKLIDRGNIIDIELDQQQQAEFQRQQKGVRAAELFYDTLRDETDQTMPWLELEPVFNEIWQWDSPENFKLEYSDPLQTLLDVDLNNLDKEDAPMSLYVTPPQIRYRFPGIAPKYRPEDSIGLWPPSPIIIDPEDPGDLEMRFPAKNKIHDIFSGPPSPDHGS
ncbi:hypothetical protein TWF730_007978 [Orbilia blumenaviensis]|uniref:Uncharacterized protein n=1 Tax=Orbilia blumenaviensis TaxID=1796055 RepID=A0AAV9V9Q2_9PEZI